MTSALLAAAPAGALMLTQDKGEITPLKGLTRAAAAGADAE